MTHNLEGTNNNTARWNRRAVDLLKGYYPCGE